MIGDRCRDCLNLTENRHGSRLIYRCGLGHFDVGNTPYYYAWSGIERPNKTVRQIQALCYYFSKKEVEK